MAFGFIGEFDEVVDIRVDRVFKAVFTRNTQFSQGALIRFISALICRNVSVIEMTANEPPVDRLGERHIRFDINCILENGEPVNIEMCFNPKPFEPVKLEYYIGKLYTGQDIRGVEKTYNDLKQTYQIAILAEKKIFPDEVFLHTFEYFDPGNMMPLKGLTRIITLELSKLRKIINKPVEEMNSQERWAIFLQYLTYKDKREKINEIIESEEGIKMACKVLYTISKEQEERWLEISAEKYELDRRSEIAYEKEIQKKEFIDLLKSGMSPEDIIKKYE